MPQLWVVAGPNGAGKTTLVLHRLAHRIEIVNPDEIADGLPRINGKLDERRAGELAIERRNALLASGTDLAIETTLAGSSPLRFLDQSKAAGYKVTLVYVGLSSPDLSIRRVLDRVRQGGHAVPVSALERRYTSSLTTLARALPLADRSYVFDNSDRRRRLLVIQECDRTRYVAANLPAWATSALPKLHE